MLGFAFIGALFLALIFWGMSGTECHWNPNAVAPDGKMGDEVCTHSFARLSDPVFLIAALVLVGVAVVIIVRHARAKRAELDYPPPTPGPRKPGGGPGDGGTFRERL